MHSSSPDILQWPAVEIVPSGPVNASFVAPSSKSYTNRALLLAALADGESRITRPLQSDDTRHMAAALAAFGVETVAQEDALLVRGCGGRFQAPIAPLHCGLSGTTLRFLAAVAAIGAGETVLTGDAPLLRRPIGPLADALTRLGATVRWLGAPGFPPLAVSGPLRGGETSLDASKSSQFLTALLLAAPYAQAPVTVHATGLASRPYVEMTLAAMREFGADAHAEGDRFTVEPAPYRARAYEVEYDASSAAHLFAFAATTGGRITVENAAEGTLQPDARFTDSLAAMGCDVTRNGASLTVAGPQRLSALHQDLGETPDMTTPLAVVCAYAAGESRLFNVEIVRGHETDRLAATATELRRMAILVTEERDGLRITGGTSRGSRIATYHDHRMAMSFASAAARTPGVIIEDPGCVAKTFPGFWAELLRAGLRLSPR